MANTPVAVRVNIEIMREFVRLRSWAMSVAKLSARLEALEGKYDEQFKSVFQAIRALMEPPPTPRKRIGFGASRGQ